MDLKCPQNKSTYKIYSKIISYLFELFPFVFLIYYFDVVFFLVFLPFFCFTLRWFNSSKMVTSTKTRSKFTHSYKAKYLKCFEPRRENKGFQFKLDVAAGVELMPKYLS